MQMSKALLGPQRISVLSYQPPAELAASWGTQFPLGQSITSLCSLKANPVGSCKWGLGEADLGSLGLLCGEAGG